VAVSLNGRRIEYGFMQMVSAMWKRLLIKRLLAKARQNQLQQQNLPAAA